MKDLIPKNMRFTFVYGCSLELACSLHVITDPSHHVNCLDWYDQCIMSIEKKLVKKIVDFGEKYARWTLIMDIVDDFSRPPSSFSTFTDDFPQFIRRFHDLPREEFSYIFLGEELVGERDVIYDLLQNPQNLDHYALEDVYQYIKKEDVAYFISHVDEVRKDVIEIMTEYYNCFFRDYWKKTCAFYRGALLKEQKEFSVSDAHSFIISIHDKLSYLDGTLLVKKHSTFTVQYSKIKEIKVILSAFTYPHLMFNLYNTTLSIYRNMLMPIMTSSLDTLADTAKIFSDPTRLTIIKLLMNGELTNKALSSLLGISTAAVSQHLKALKDASLLHANRDKNTIFYHINPEEMDHIIQQFTHFLQI